MRAETISPFDSLSPRDGVCVADGYGVKIFVRYRRLVVCDGIGHHRRERVFARATAGIKRVVVLGHEGFVTLEALRWMADVDIAFVHVDRDGKLIGASCTSRGWSARCAARRSATPSSARIGRVGNRQGRRASMARILTVAPEQAKGLRRLAMWLARRRYGYVPGITQVLLPDLRVATAIARLYKHLHMRPSSPLTRMQREMLATVVNGAVGGAP